MKFKVGDKVRIKDSCFEKDGSLYDFEKPKNMIGKVASISDTNDGIEYAVKIKLPGFGNNKFEWLVHEHELEEA